MKIELKFDDSDICEMQKMKRMLQADSCFSFLWEMANGQHDLSIWRDENDNELSEEEMAKLKEWLSNVIHEGAKDRDINLELWN